MAREHAQHRTLARQQGFTSSKRNRTHREMDRIDKSGLEILTDGSHTSRRPHIPARTPAHRWGARPPKTVMPPPAGYIFA